MASFWDQVGPGLFGTGVSTGVNILGEQRAGRQQQKLVRDVRGPLYDQQNQLAAQSLGLAAGADPQKMAAERFAAQQALLAPGDEAQRQDLMRQLQKQGLLGAASFEAVPGTAATPGVAMNPHMAALFAAQAGARQKSAYDSLREGEQYLDQLIKRSDTLQAGNRQMTTAALQNKVLTPKPSIAGTALKGASGLLQNKGVQKALFEGLKGLPGMFKGLFGPDISQSTAYQFDDYEPGGYDIYPS